MQGNGLGAGEITVAQVRHPRETGKARRRRLGGAIHEKGTLRGTSRTISSRARKKNPSYL